MKTLLSLRVVVFFASLLAVPLSAAASKPAAQPTIQLGTVTVTGRAKVVQALEAIKLALAQPTSDDPKLADVVICRIHDKVGSHLNQVLTCATNRTLGQRRDRTRQGWLAGQQALGGMPAFVTALNEYLTGMPGQVLHMNVNGPAFRALLRKLPPPTADVYLYRTQAPAGGTRQNPLDDWR